MGLVWALASGSLGALASCFAKFAFAPSMDSLDNKDTSAFCASGRDLYTGSNVWHYFLAWLTCHGGWTLLLRRGACLGLMVACNAAMVACFVGGLQDAGSIAGTALATAANFLVSALFGYLVWDEAGGATHGGGLVLVVLGTMLLVWAQRPVVPKEESHKQK